MKRVNNSMFQYGNPIRELVYYLLKKEFDGVGIYYLKVTRGQTILFSVKKMP
jgi:hypothetical protein